MNYSFIGNCSLVRISFISSVIVFITSCKKNEETTVTNQAAPTYLNVQLNTKSAYYTKDSLANITLDDAIYNNLGIGVNSSTKYERNSIFSSNISLKPIVKHSVNEYFTKNIVASWDSNKNKHITDSILTTVLKLNSSFSLDTSKFYIQHSPILDSCIYIDFVLINRFGLAELDLNSKLLNNYLTYKTSLGSGSSADDIALTPQQYYDIFGDKYKSAIVLGTFLKVELEIVNITFTPSKKGEILAEAIGLFKQVVNENADWDVIKKNSKYLSHANCLISNAIAIPGLNSCLFLLRDLHSEIISNDKMYRKLDFGILNSCSLPYSTVYPKFKFIKK